MTAFVDTNVIVRHLIGEPDEAASAATRFLNSGETCLLPDLIVAEAMYVLRSVYGLQRPRIAYLMRSLLALDGVHAAAESLLHRAIEVYEAVRLDFADAYLVASAEVSGVGRIASFDRGIDRVHSVERVEP